MARSGKAAAPDFKEFEYTGKEFKYSGRIYPKTTKSGDKIDSTVMSVCLNGVFTVKGCHLIQSDKKTWIQFPQYKDNSGNYVSYVYTDKEFSQAELDKVAEEAEKALNS